MKRLHCPSSFLEPSLSDDSRHIQTYTPETPTIRPSSMSPYIKSNPHTQRDRESQVIEYTERPSVRRVKGPFWCGRYGNAALYVSALGVGCHICLSHPTFARSTFNTPIPPLLTTNPEAHRPHLPFYTGCAAIYC